MKSVMVHLDASPRAAERLQIAARLCQSHGAELTVVYGVVSSLLGSPWMASDVRGQLAAALTEIDRRQRERARALFDDCAGPAVRWLEADSGRLSWSLLRRALVNELLVLGQYDPADATAGALPAGLVPSLIIDSGRPALVVPHQGRFEAAPDIVLLAWKPTREAARAASAALPWLRRARQVHLAAAAEADEPGSLDDVEHWLTVEGVVAPIARHSLGAADVGDGLLSLAADLDAALLVMGCYGHGRASEWALGGATRTVLKTMTLPVLMAH